jgi:hypothetical protein
MALLLGAYAAAGQQYVRKNETVVFSFETENHKRCVIARDSNDAYIVYRFGTPTKIELEYPPRNARSWSTMKYYWYLRPGFELNYLNFVRGNLRYVIYETYSNEDDTAYSEIGVKVLNLNDSFLYRIPGKPGTETGALLNLRDYEQLGKGKEYSNE